MLRPGSFTLPAILLMLLWPTGAAAAPEPIPVIEILPGNALSEAEPHISPDGEQIVTYQGPGGNSLYLVERGNAGGPFLEPLTLSTSGSVEPPSLSFTPDGGIYAIWGIALSGGVAEQTIRPPGGGFESHQPAVGCDRFVDSAVGPAGEIAVACSHRLATNPPDTIRYGVAPSLGPVTVNEDLVPPAYENFMIPRMDWGPDGTLAIVSRGRKTFTVPPPANETVRIRVSLKGTVSYTEDVAEATWPNEVFSSQPVTLEDGTVAVGLGGTEGARVEIRPPGMLTVFTPFPLLGEDVAGIGRDSAQNIHLMSADSSLPNRQYWATVRAPNGDFGAPSPLPLAGAGDPYIPYDTFRVADDGTEYALINADDGVYATSRLPGQAFTTPRRLGDVADGNPTSAVTPDGDLLAAWIHESSPTEKTLTLGGLDKTPPKIAVATFPATARTGEPATFSATATDAMGVESTGWSFGSGQATAGDTVTHTFTRPGDHQVRFTATDVAGQTARESRTVVVSGKSIGPDRLSLKVKTPKRIKFRALRRGGLRVVTVSKPKMRVRIAIGTSKRKVRTRPLKAKVVRNLKRRHATRVKPRRARLGKPRKFRLFVRVTGTTATGERITSIRVVRVRR